MGKYQFGSARHQTLPFVIAGLAFFSKPLTVGEELPLAQLSDAYDEADATVEHQKEFVTGQADFLAGLLRARLAPTEGPVPLIDTDWVLRHFGVSNLISLLQFLRSGQRPSEPLELRNWADEPIEIDGLSFAMRQLNFSEQLLAADLANVEGGTAAVVGVSLDVLAQLLSSRLQDSGEQGATVTAEWLSQHLPASDIQAITSLLQNGPQAEGEDPNALGNLAFAADGLTTSSV